MITIEKLSVPVDFNLSFLKIRWSDHLLIKDGRKVVGEGVVYGGDWGKAERLARQMAEMKFRTQRNGLPICEQVFIDTINNQQSTINNIIKRHSNLKIKVGRDVIEDIRVIKFIRQQLGFPNEIRIDVNQGYSLKQLQYLIPTLKEAGINYVEEPVKVKDLPIAANMLHRYGMSVIFDESLASLRAIPVSHRESVAISSGLLRRYAVYRPVHGYAPRNDKEFIDAINIKLSRIGDINESLQLIKLAKKHNLKVVIGCSEELDRGMEAIYKLGHEAKKAGVLLEVEGFGPLRLQHKFFPVPRWFNRLENLIIIIGHKVWQFMFGIYWLILKFAVLIIKKSKLISSLSLHLVKWTGKSSQKIHPKHLIFQKYPPEFLKYLEPNDLVLDVGCGNGQNSLLAAAKVKQVIGFDIDKTQLKIAETEAVKRGLVNVRFDYVSAEIKLPYKSNLFDKVIFLGVLEHLSNRESILKEIKRVMKPGGKLLLGIPNEMTGWKKLQMSVGIQHFTDPDHELEFTRQTISDLLAKMGFKIISIEPTAFDTPWAGLIDVVGGISLNLYQKLLFWKWSVIKVHPEESISFFIIANKV
jgi:SAM-dependent methyltransferase